VAPRNPIEELIAEIWNAVLDAGTMGIHDSFFAHGGGSLQAIESLSLLRKRFDIEMSVNEFFRHPTVAQQALIVGERLGAHPGDSGAAGACAKPLKCDSAQLSRAALEKVLSERRKGAPHRKAIPLRETSSPCPLSDGQTGIWFQEQIAPGMRAYHEGDAARLEGPLDIDVLEEAINVLVERHESLRTLIQVVDGAPVQVVLDSWRLPITLVDLTDLPPLEQQTEVQRELVEEPRRAYRLDQAPGVRAMLLRLGPDVHIFMLSLHHLICDGWSLGVLFRELGDLYRAGVQRKPHALCRMDLQYGDYAAWQHGRVESGSLAGDLDFWKHYLAGVPAAIDLPIKATRPKEFSYNGKRHIHSIGRATLERLRQLGQREETSLFMVLTAAFKALLYRYTNQKDIVIGVPIANREQPELLSLVGFLIDFQALRTDLSGNPTFRTLLQRVNQGLFEVDAHRAIPFHKVVEALQPKRDLSRTPLYQVMLVWKDRHVQMQFMDLEGLKVSYVPFHAHAAKTDLTMWLTDVGDDLWVEVEYCAELFSAEMIQRLTGHFQTLLAGVVADPDCRISELPLLSETERRKLLVDWNRTEMEYPRDIPLAALVEEQAARAPDSTAVVFGEQSLTYRELNKRANQLARELVRHGAGPDALVGIFVERSLDMMVALLAVAKSGAGYLPLDTCVPAARLLHMIEDSGLRVLVTHSNLQSELPRFLGGIVTVDDVKWHANRWENLDVAVKPEQVAYAIYTSGSTGRPKCVEVSYRSLLNLLWSVRDWLNFKASDRLLAVSSISFDIAGADIWLPWVVGATTILAGREAAAEGMQLRNLIERHDITFMQATPVTWRLLLGAGWRGKPNMRIVCTGEAMPRDLAAELVPMVRTMWNLYGPTETTIWSTGYLVEDGEAPVLIGRPVGNTKCYILDEQRQPVPIGSIGELCIAGDGLARGYRNRPELTEEKFVPNPLSREPGARMYRTGDLARYRPDGNIECLGRLDHQVKIRGFRIELGEIEAALAQCPGVAQSAVLAREDCPGDKRLVAYLVPQADTELSVSALRTALQGRLPDYMVPMAFVALASLPLTPNGKLDRKALPAPDPRRLELDQAYEAPRTPIEKQLAAIWAHVLGLETIGIHDNFFELGGHSLLATRVIARVREEFNVNVPLRALFDAPRLAEFGLQVLQALIDAAPDDAPDRRQGIALTAAHC
jgi:amino acid adenylation domain-containing protein